MTRMKKKKLKVKAQEIKSIPEEKVKKIPIDNLPDNFLWMHIKNGTKIRNVLEYALKHFPERKSIVWTGIDRSINKTISCSQLFKKKIPGLHQVTRLQYVPSDKKTTEPKDSDKKVTESEDSDKKTTEPKDSDKKATEPEDSDKKATKSEDSGKRPPKYVPEIHIFLSKNPTHAAEPGYQGPEDTGKFSEPEISSEAEKTKDPSSLQSETPGSSSSKLTSFPAEEFAAMGLRTGQKRSRKEQQSETLVKKNKKKE